jgi:NAD-dependent SIR2 family protein deacetylase
MDVYLFGAGASATEGAPATQDFFAQGWELLSPTFDDRIQAVWTFLETIFRVPITNAAAFADIPAVDEIFSLIDWSLHVDQGLGRCYSPPQLYQMRRNLEHLLCATLDAALESRQRRASGPHARFVRKVLEQPARPFALLSMNYDTLLDDALTDGGALPDYGFRDLDIRPSGGPLLAKLHGSLNWAHCSACDHVQVADAKVAHLLPHVEGLSCCRCGNDRLHGVIISPTWLKAYTGSQLRHVWDLALECIQHAERIIFVGYSMPMADIPIFQMLRRGLLTRRQHAWPRIEVINHVSSGWSESERLVHQRLIMDRFTHLFGKGVQFDFHGFSGQTHVP